MNNNNNFVKRLSRDSTYKRPAKTFQETLTNDEIKEKLEGYKKISDINDLNIGSHLRYFTKDKTTKKMLFRSGGMLNAIRQGDKNKYLILSNGTVSWSVQNDGNNIFWAKMSQKEYKDIIETEIQEKTNVDNEVNEKYKKLKQKNDYIVKLLEDQQKENEKLSKKIKDIEDITKKEKLKNKK
jgi:hypothetical protein